MANKKLRLANTDADNLVSNLRGEIAEVVTTWTLLRRFIATGAKLSSGDPLKDWENPDLGFTYVLKDKLEDELVARLSELAEKKIGRLNFFFATEKLGKFQGDASLFSDFIEARGFRKKRNFDVSHKEIPEKWEDHRAPVHIPYRIIVRAVALGLRLMKRIDRYFLGPSAPYLWREVRKRRYKPIVSPPRVQCLLVPHYRVSAEDRIQIALEEEREGMEVWTEMQTQINGFRTTLPVCKKWGVIMFKNGPIALDEYPLQELTSIQVSSPIYEERVVVAKYKCGHVNQDRLCFEPVERQHIFNDGIRTDLVDFNINLNDDIRKSMGVVNVGDVKEFKLKIKVLAGFEVSGDTKLAPASS